MLQHGGHRKGKQGNHDTRPLGHADPLGIGQGSRRQGFVDIQAKQGRGTVEQGVKGTEHGAQQHRQEKTPGIAGQNIPHQLWVGQVDGFQPVTVQVEGDHPGQHHQHRHQNLEEPRQQDAPLSLGQVAGRQGALDDVLVGTPIKKVRENHPGEQGREGRRVIRRPDGIELFSFGGNHRG